VAYRRSWFNEIGVKEFPKTWDEYREVGKKLKAKGKPIGQALGHSFGDPPVFAYAFLWDFGGAEVDASGKKVVINSKGTLESVKFLQAFWKDACDEGGLAWDDTNNNRAFHAGEIGATLNGASIYIVAKRQKDKIKDEKGEPLYQDIEHAALIPKGPAGQFALYLPFQHSVMKYSKNQKLAKDFLKWLHQDANYGKWFEVNEGYSVGAAKKWEDHPMWAKVDKPLQVFRQAARLRAPSRERAAPGVRPPQPDGRSARRVHRVSVRDGRVVLAVEHQRGQSRRVRGSQELHQGVERLDLSDGVLEHDLLHVLGDDLQARPGHVAGAAPEPALPGQAPRPGLDAAPVHHSDGALHLRVAL